MDADLIDPEAGRRIPAQELLADLAVICRPHAQDLGCSEELERLGELAKATGAKRQLQRSRSLGSLPRLVGVLADEFLAGA